MKKIYLYLYILFNLLLICGCSKTEENTSKTESNSISRTISCYNETYLFKSKKSVEHILSISKGNHLVQYESIEKYFDFTDFDDFNMICDGSSEEAENNNKLYPYLKEVADCNRDSMQVTISDVYDISKLESKNNIPTDLVKDALNDQFLIDIDSFKTNIINIVFVTIRL